MYRYFLLFLLFAGGIAYTGQAQKDAAYDQIKQQLIKSQRRLLFNGGLAIQKEGQNELIGSFGHSGFGVKNEDDSVFEMASIGKTLTAVAVAKLVEDGLLGYDDTVIEHLPELSKYKHLSTITLRQLLTHSSGLVDIFSRGFIDIYCADNNLSIPEYFALYDGQEMRLDTFIESALLFSPGESFSYSNSGYLLVGKVIEAVAGESYEKVVEEFILIPLGMTNTSLKSSYGGGPTTMQDLIKFGNGLLDNAILSESSKSHLFSNHLPTDLSNQWSLGFELLNVEGKTVLSHKGGHANSKAQFFIWPGSGRVGIIYSNNNQKGYKVFDKLRAMMAEDL